MITSGRERGILRQRSSQGKGLGTGLSLVHEQNHKQLRAAPEESGRQAMTGSGA